ncbi:MAG: hypothetical protein SGJ19_13080 [Planctomycetia bacterium]|nr:hypothetical protein [Planctomycetia bacterium]
MSKVLDESTRREAFLSLVSLQDGGVAVITSREQVAASYQISVSLVQLIEREGLRKQWPPLNREQRDALPEVLVGEADLATLRAAEKSE